MGGLMIGDFMTDDPMTHDPMTDNPMRSDLMTLDPKLVWKEFVGLLKSRRMPPDKIWPLHPELKDPLYRVIMQFPEVPDTAWPDNPKAMVRGNHINFLVRFEGIEHPADFVFMFEVDGGTWFFRHLENIRIPIDSVPELPASTFPDVPEATKAWMRAEIQTTKDVRLFNHLKQEKGRDFALDWFRDGNGYFVAARSWIPLLPESDAFVLYLCWEQSVLQGNRVILERLSPEAATIRIRPLCFQLFEQTGHLRHQICYEDYVALFDTIWKDRASAAGWNLEITYMLPDCVFNFTRQVK